MSRAGPKPDGGGRVRSLAIGPLRTLWDVGRLAPAERQ